MLREEVGAPRAGRHPLDRAWGGEAAIKAVGSQLVQRDVRAIARAKGRLERVTGYIGLLHDAVGGLAQQEVQHLLLVRWKRLIQRLELCAEPVGRICFAREWL